MDQEPDRLTFDLVTQGPLSDDCSVEKNPPGLFFGARVLSACPLVIRLCSPYLCLVPRHHAAMMMIPRNEVEKRISIKQAQPAAETRPRFRTRALLPLPDAQPHGQLFITMSEREHAETWLD